MASCDYWKKVACDCEKDVKFRVTCGLHHMHIQYSNGSLKQQIY
jgi:hypothetical protein